MLFLIPLFDPKSYLVKSFHGKQSIYKGNRILLARLTFSQFTKAEKAGLLRPMPGKGKFYVLNRKALRAMHGKNKIKKLYLKFASQGSLPMPEVLDKVEAPPVGLFAQTGERLPETPADRYDIIPATRTIISELAIDKIKDSQGCRRAIQEFYKITPRSLRNWLTDANVTLTTPDAIKIIGLYTNLPAQLILKTISI